MLRSRLGVVVLVFVSDVDVAARIAGAAVLSIVAAAAGVLAVALAEPADLAVVVLSIVAAAGVLAVALAAGGVVIVVAGCGLVVARLAGLPLAGPLAGDDGHEGIGQVGVVVLPAALPAGLVEEEVRGRLQDGEHLGAGIGGEGELSFEGTVAPGKGAQVATLADGLVAPLVVERRAGGRLDRLGVVAKLGEGPVAGHLDEL